MVAEGAGAAPVALAISGIAGNGKVACVISGGNLNTDVLTKILSGMVPKKMRMGQ
jgi:threonine dehydratase